MMIKAIDYVVKAIETKADAVGYEIDGHTPYRAMCQIITDFEYEGKEPTFAEKEYCANTLKDLCAYLGLNYAFLLEKAIAR
jgi:hypothetical protein